MAEETKKNEIGDKLVDEALKAYGIDKKYVLASRIDALTGEAVVVTHGGKKMRYAAGQEVRKLDEIAVTGINPKNAERKVIAGAPKKK